MPSAEGSYRKILREALDEAPAEISEKVDFAAKLVLERYHLHPIFRQEALEGWVRDSIWGLLGYRLELVPPGHRAELVPAEDDEDDIEAAG